MKIALPPQGKQGRNQRRHFRWDVRATEIGVEPLTGAEAALDGSETAGCAISRLPPAATGTPKRVRRR